ncbi:MAG: hypothetical protein J4F46_11135 [Dehalococcoidia bacterium]|nr:hypothetical protein [Dehalococcoidia bacterium]
MENGCPRKEAGESPERRVGDGDLSSTATFIDVLFAVVMGLGLTQVMKLDWFESLSFSSALNSRFEIAVIFVGYLTLFCSWWGYHRSLRRRQEPRGTIGVLIFAVDILLLACYWLLLVRFESLLFVLSVLFVVFVFYVAWDTLRWLKERKEPPGEDPDAWQRRAVTIFSMVFMAVILGAYVALDCSRNLFTGLEWVFVVLAYVVLLEYRIHKEKRYFGRILDLLVLKFRYKEAN